MPVCEVPLVSVCSSECSYFYAIVQTICKRGKRICRRDNLTCILKADPGVGIVHKTDYGKDENGLQTDNGLRSEMQQRSNS